MLWGSAPPEQTDVDMNKPLVWARILIGAGLFCMLIGAIDPLEGSFFVLLGIALAALGSFIGKSQYSRLLSWSFALAAIGVGAMVALSALGGIGGSSGNPLWWGVFILPYPIGWAVGILSGGIAFFETWRFHARTRHASK
jgi:hypothetical protein